jgi:choline kinase
MDIIAITVCVNYADILKHMITQNAKFLKAWYIVTSPEDLDTQNLIKGANLENIHVMIYNDFYKNSTFNKGGSLRFVQEHVNKEYKSSNILILDADIYLPDNFIESLPTIEDDTMYGISERLDYWTLDDFINNTNPHHQKGFLTEADFLVGFFQLYKQCEHKYKNSYNCSKCDILFRDMFSKQQAINLTVKHLGREILNWDGRKKSSVRF